MFKLSSRPSLVFLFVIGCAIPAAAQYACDAACSPRCESACDAMPSSCFCTGSIWTIRADGLFLHRAKPDSQVLAFNTSDLSENLNANHFDFGYHTGFDVSIAARLTGKLGMEIRYFGVDYWDASQLVGTTRDDSIRFNSDPALFADAGDALGATYQSELHNGEINLRHQCLENIEFLAGFRYLELDERGLMGLIDADVPFGIAVATRNRMYGGQLGAKALLWCCDLFSLDVDGKAGVFGNSASQSSIAASNVAELLAADSLNLTSFVGELGLSGAVTLTQGLAIRGGYRVLWVEQVALATRQLAATDFFAGTGINGTGGVFYHGATAGLEVTF